MSLRDELSTNPDILASAKALQRAARRALQLGKRTGTPVYVLRDGQIVDLLNKKPWAGSPSEDAGGQKPKPSPR